MRSRTLVYVAVPLLVLAIVLSNAFFGHVLFEISYERLINKYSVYVHLQPEWKSHPGNILYDVTNVWSDPLYQGDSSVYDLSTFDPDDLSSLATYNNNQLRYQNSKSYVELRHEFSDCKDAWVPIPYRYAVDSMRSWIEVVQGVQIAKDTHVDAAYESAANEDPYVWIFPNVAVSNTIHDDGSLLDMDMVTPIITTTNSNTYTQFIPVCISDSKTYVTYDYAVSVSGSDVGFDVYFAKPLAHKTSDYTIHGYHLYDGPGCSAKGYGSFSGTCSGVEPGSGLLVVLPDDLDQSLTRVRVGLYERVTPVV